jgi:hypothetical protein
MADVWVLLLIVAFFGVCVTLVRACDRIIGSDEAADTAPASATELRDAETIGAAR